MIIIKQELQALCNVQESACMWDIVNTGLDFGLDFWMYFGLLRFYVFFMQRIPCFFKIFTINQIHNVIVNYKFVFEISQYNVRLQPCLTGNTTLLVQA